MCREAVPYLLATFYVNGAADGTRTRNNQLGRLMLYQLNYRRGTGRADRIRTCDPLLPKQVRYQTAPRPDLTRALDRDVRGRTQGERQYSVPDTRRYSPASVARRALSAAPR